MSRKERSRGKGARAATASASDAASSSAISAERLRWIVLAVVLLVAALIVAGAFNRAPHSGGDNAGYVSLAYSLVAHHSYTEVWDPAGLPHTKYPPVFPALLAVLILLGARTWTALKTVAAVSTIVAVGFTYLWAERRLGVARAAGVAVALALSSSVVYYSHWVLSDPTFLAFTMVSLWALDRADEEGAGVGWLVVGALAATLAYFTRSAGVPLVVALAGWLALRKRWRALVAVAIGVGVPVFLWWLRARLVGHIEYASEFWMVDPYNPSLGHVGLGGLIGRVLGNIKGYTATYLPTGIVGRGGGPGVVVLGIALVALAVVGWVRRGVRRIGVVEIFLPLYAAVILLWPQVWSGDRFALPLLPVLFVLALEALWDGARKLGGPAAVGAGIVALLVVVLPAFGNWLTATRQASACEALIETSGPFACYGPGFTQFAEAATWSGSNLPRKAVVLSRKPRIFYVLSGVRSRTFPFETSSTANLALADSVGARYELLDEIDGLAGHYVGGAIRQRPGAYCALRAFSQGARVGTRMFGVLPPAQRGPEQKTAPGTGVRIEGCPPSYLRGPAGAAGYASSPPSSRIPLLDGLDP